MRTFYLNKSKSYQIVEDSVDLTKVHIHVSKLINNEYVIQKSIPLILDNHGGDLVSFGAYICETRRFILINAKYSIYLLNLYNNKIIGPISSKFYGEGADAQSGMLTGLKIIYDGRFITGYSVDNGAFLIDLTNLNQPKESRSAMMPLSLGLHPKELL
jgi:hypothetical protein